MSSSPVCAGPRPSAARLVARASLPALVGAIGLTLSLTALPTPSLAMPGGAGAASMVAVHTAMTSSALHGAYRSHQDLECEPVPVTTQVVGPRPTAERLLCQARPKAAAPTWTTAIALGSMLTIAGAVLGLVWNIPEMEAAARRRKAEKSRKAWQKEHDRRAALSPEEQAAMAFSDARVAAQHQTLLESRPLPRNSGRRRPTF